MAKKKIELEYPLSNVSGPILWNAISTSIGLQTWMANKVTDQERVFTFEWSEDEIRQAEMTHKRNNSHVRFHWLDDDDPQSYFELGMDYNELTGDYTLTVTDTVEEDEAEEITDLWNIEVESLLRLYSMNG